MNSFPPVTPTTTNPQDLIPPHFLPPDCTPEEWRRSIMVMWTRARRYDWSIPDNVLDRMRDVLLGRVSLEPIKMVLYCPACNAQHIDAPDDPFKVGTFDGPTLKPRWDNPPHRSHLCRDCGCIWRPADVPTEGVRAIETRGNADTWPRAYLTTRAPL